jgi:trimeric autotransporter adhesin
MVRWPHGSLLLLPLLAALCHGVGVSAPSAGPSDGAMPPIRGGSRTPDLGGFATPDGRIDLDAIRASGYEGPLGLSGARLVLDSATMEPVVASPAGAVAGGDENWWEGFGSPFPSPGLNDEVTSLVTFRGELIVAGLFTRAGTTNVRYIARWDGTSWHPLGSGLDAGVVAMTVYNDRLIVGGSFSIAGGVIARRIAQWDGERWSSLGSGIGTMDGDYVRALAVYDGDLIAGGGFAEAGGVVASCIARWDGSAWYPIGSGVAGGADGPAVCVLAEYHGELVVGGAFNRAGGVPASYIARWNGEEWASLGNGVNLWVTSLGVHDDRLIAGGWFTSAGYQGAAYVASWNGSNWRAIGSGLNSAAYAIAEYRGTLYATGYFTASGAEPVAHIARWNGTEWQKLLLGLDDDGSALLVQDDKLFVGGRFRNAGGSSAGRVAVWDGSSWGIFGGVGDPGLGSNGPILALALFQGDLIAGGSFRQIGGTQAVGIARWDGRTWAPLGAGVDTYVEALTVHGGELLAGGPFTVAGDEPASAIAAWDGSRWRPLGLGFSGGSPYTTVRDLTVYQGDLIAGGHFRTADGTSANQIARWDGAAWLPLGEGVAGGYFGNSGVEALEVYGERLIAGGWFLQAGGIEAPKIAAWDGAAWGPVGAGIEAVDYPSVVQTLAVFQGRLIAGGLFSSAGGLWVQNIAGWDGASWSPVGPISQCNGAVQALAVTEGDLVMGGRFTMIGAIAANRIAIWDGAELLPLGSGIDGDVSCIGEGAEGIFVGGSFGTAGGHESSNIAVWSEPSLVTFPMTAVGDTTTVHIEIINPDSVTAVVRDLSPPESPFRLGQAFLDSAAAGIEIPSQSSIRTAVRFAPLDEGVWTATARYSLEPSNRSGRIRFSGQGQVIRMSWTTAHNYAGHLVDSGESIRIEMTMGDYVVADSLVLWFREGGDRGFERQRMQLVWDDARNDRYSGETPEGIAGCRGFQFYVRAHRGTATALFRSAEHPESFRVRVDQLRFPAPQPALSYKMISFPIVMERNRVGNVIWDDVGRPDSTQWRLFRRDGQIREEYREIKEQDDEGFVQGMAYWLITRDAATLDLEPAFGTSTPTDSVYILQLKLRWNMMGNPFAYPILWDSIHVQTLAHGRARPASKPVSVTDPASPLLVERPVWWNPETQAYETGVTVLQPFEGYWMLNRTQSPIELYIPPSASAVAGVPRSKDTRAAAVSCGKPVEGSWRARIVASNDSANDRENFAGVRPGASSLLDRFDLSEPPLPPQGGISLFFPHEDWNAACDRLAADIRSVPEGSETAGWIWDFDVVCPAPDGTVAVAASLDFPDLASVPGDLEATLVDRDLGRQVNLREEPTYRFLTGQERRASDRGVTRFAFLVGAAPFVRDASAEAVLLPQKTALRAPWPNPVSGPVRIRYDVAQKVVVSLAVFDLLGARVRLLEEGVRVPGAYELLWDGALAGGRKAPAGVYFLRLRAGPLTIERKIVRID